jgi:hypothetical protein
LEGRNGIAKYDPVQDYTAPSGNFMSEIWRDLRFAVRTMRKGPLFVLSVVLILGLGIGANTTVFTLINTLILNPPPVPDSSGLMGVGLASPLSTRSWQTITGLAEKSSGGTCDYLARPSGGKL